MEIRKDFCLEVGSSITIKKNSGNKCMEFSRHSDPILDNIVEMWTYDIKKGKSGKPTWLILKDLSVFLNSYLAYGEYTIVESGTKSVKKSKK